MNWCNIQRILIFLILQLWGFSCNKILYFPIQIHDSNTQQVTQHEISVDVFEEDIEYVVFSYCEQFKIQESSCKYLYTNIVEKVENWHAENSINDDTHTEATIPYDQTLELPNSHLSRHEKAVSAETERLFSDRSKHDYTAIMAAEDAAVNSVLHAWNGRDIRRIAVIHSCMLSESSFSVLADMLEQLQGYGLMDQLDSLVVLNYGEPLPEAVRARYAHPCITWLYMGDQVLYFEVPSLRVAQRLSQHLAVQGVGAQLLYLHTKGVSYKEQHPQIQDWSDMMLYFLAGRANTCYHLLQSGEVDCIGANYKSEPRRLFSGNFWWASAQYLATLPALDYGTTGKYEAESWLLDQSGARIFVMHHAHVNHAVQRYPPLCYTEAVHRVAHHRLPVPPQQQQLSFDRNAVCGGPHTVRESRRFWQLW